MDKPLSAIIKEVKMKLASVCNESVLPLPILDLVVQEIYFEVHRLAEKQAVAEELAYMNAVKNNEKALGDSDETE